MATNFSANQYENAFRANRLQQWTVPQLHRERPVQRCGATQVITNDRGHLLKSSMKSCEHPLGTFRGTWSMTKNDMVKTVPAIKRTTAPFSTTSRTDATMAHSAPDRVLN